LSWILATGGTGMDHMGDVQYDQNGDLVAVGHIAGNGADFDLGPDSTIYNSTNSDAFIAKYAFDGTLLWGHVIGGTNGSEFFNSVTIDSNGDIIVVGGYCCASFDLDPDTSSISLLSNFGNGANLFVAKFSSLGDLLWNFQIGSNMAYIDGIGTLDEDDNIILTGTFSSTTAGLDMNPGPGSDPISSASIHEDVFVAKYSPNGSFLWAFSIGGDQGFERGTGIVTDDSGKIYVCGIIESEDVDFDPGLGQTILGGSAPGPGHMFLGRYSPIGELDWVFTIGSSTAGTGAYPFGIDLSPSNDVVLTGSVQGTNLDLDPGPDTSIFNGPSSNSHILIAKYSSNGTYLWHHAFGSTSAVYNDSGNDVNVDQFGIIRATGFTSSTMDVDPSASNFILTNDGIADAFLLEFDGTGQFINAFSTSGTDICAGYNVAVSATSITMAGDYRGNNFAPDHWNNGMTYDANGIRDIFIATYDNLSTNIGSSENSWINIYPNPSNHGEPITFDQQSQEYMVEGVYAIDGRRVIEFHGIGSPLTISTANLPRGVYILRTSDKDGEIWNSRFVVQ